MRWMYVETWKQARLKTTFKAASANVRVTQNVRQRVAHRQTWLLLCVVVEATDLQ